MKRQRTVWIWKMVGANRTGIFVGYIHNKAKDNPYDVIRVRIISRTCNIQFNCRYDEAVILAAGLTKVAARMLVGQLPLSTARR